MNQQQCQIAALLVPSLAKDYWLRLQYGCPLPFTTVFHSTEKQLRHLGFKPALCQKIQSIKWENIQKIEQELTALNISWISIEDESYPHLLKQIPDPPLGIFAKGNLRLLKQAQLAVVGSRKPTSSARSIAQRWSQQLSSLGLTITSGMALGIDSAAHLGALAAKGKTIAVLGCGLNHIYPKQHINLAQTILDSGGTLISEYPPNTRAHPHHFPQRNRIVTGLSMGVIVVEAAIKSGSLISARLANEQGREVFAMPGNIMNNNSAGCHQLIQNGAKLVINTEQILEEILWKPTNSIQKACDIDEEENKVLECINEHYTTTDDIIIKSGLAFPEVCSILLQLEIKGKVGKSLNGYTKLIG